METQVDLSKSSSKSKQNAKLATIGLQVRRGNGPPIVKTGSRPAKSRNLLNIKVEEGLQSS